MDEELTGQLINKSMEAFSSPLIHQTLGRTFRSTTRRLFLNTVTSLNSTTSMILTSSGVTMTSSVLTDVPPPKVATSSGAASHPLYILWTVLAPIIFLVGAVGNSLILVVMTRRSMRGTSTSIYLSVMAAADLLVLVFGLVPDWLKESRLVDMFETYPNVACQLFRFLFFTSGDVSVWILVLFTIDRFIAICFPLHKNAVCTAVRSKRYSIIVVIIAVIKNVHLFWSRGAQYKMATGAVSNPHPLPPSSSSSSSSSSAFLPSSNLPYEYTMTEDVKADDVLNATSQRQIYDAARRILNMTSQLLSNETASHQMTPRAAMTSSSSPQLNLTRLVTSRDIFNNSASGAAAPVSTVQWLFVKNCGSRPGFEEFENFVRPWIVFTFVYLIPFVTIAVSNVFIVKALRQVRRERIECAIVTTSSDRSMMQMTMMCLSASVCFIVCIAPSIVLLILRPYYSKSQWYIDLKAANNLLPFVNHSINFFLYCLTGSRFRHVILITFYCRRCLPALDTTDSLLDLRRASAIDTRSLAVTLTGGAGVDIIGAGAAGSRLSLGGSRGSRLSVAGRDSPHRTTRRVGAGNSYSPPRGSLGGGLGLTVGGAMNAGKFLETPEQRRRTRSFDRVLT